MPTTLAAVITGLGLVLALTGVGCGLRAYVLSVREHDTAPVWPWADRQVQRVRALLPSRKPAGRIVSVAGIASAEAFGSATVTVDEGPPGDVQVQLERLRQRIEGVESRLVAERQRSDEADARIRAELIEQGQRLDGADEQLGALARSVAVSTARLQLVGLILVGLGTALMAVPAVVTPFL